MTSPTAPGALAADIGVIDLDPRPGGAHLVTAVAFDHCLHQLVLDPPGSIGRNPEPPAQLDIGQSGLPPVEWRGEIRASCGCTHGDPFHAGPRLGRGAIADGRMQTRPLAEDFE